MLLYEMKCVKVCHDPWNIPKEYLGWHGWDDQLEKIKKAEAEVKEYMAEYSTEEIKKHVREAAIDLSAMRSELREWRQRDEEVEQDTVIGRLSVKQYADVDVKVLNQKRFTNTCGWFRQDASYGEWLHSKEACLLLVSAPPGCGKSILSAYLIEEELRLQWPDEQICYYFFKDQEERENITTALRAILHQLLLDCPAIVRYIESDVRRQGEGLMTNFKELKEIFDKAIRMRSGGPVICLLDALDECNPRELKDLITWLASPKWRLGNSDQESHHKVAPMVKFLVTTRGLPKIVDEFMPFEGKYLHIPIANEPKRLQGDINLVMEERFHEFVKKFRLDENPETRDSLWKALKKVGGGQLTYLWVELIFELLSRGGLNTEHDWETLINSAPVEIFDTYDRLLQSVKPMEKQPVQILLQLVYAAERPLTIEEAHMATAIQRSEKTEIHSVDDIKRFLMPNDNLFQDWIIQACGFFVSVSGGRLFFIHQTAKDYLRDHQGKSDEHPLGDSMASKNRKPSPFRGSFSDRSAHAMMTECCITILPMDFESLEWDEPEAIPLQHYAVAHFVNHFILSQGSRPDENAIFRETTRGTKTRTRRSRRFPLAYLLGDGRMTISQHLLLLALMARAVMQDYNSNCRCEQWSTDRIHFLFERREDILLPGNFLNESHLAILIESTSHKQRRLNGAPPHINPERLALGILLLEIQMCKRIDDLGPGEPPGDDSKEKSHSLTTFEKATYIMKPLDWKYKGLGSNRKVIYDLILGFNSHRKADDIQVQRDALCTDVILPLEATYTTIFGKSPNIPQIHTVYIEDS